MSVTPPICPTCQKPARLTNGQEIYPHRPDLATKALWICDTCPETYVSCHLDTDEPLGTLAGPALRKARMALHQNHLDPLWRNRDGTKTIAKRATVYAYLAFRMGLPSKEVHVGLFDEALCAHATSCLTGTTPESVAAWAIENPELAKRRG